MFGLRKPTVYIQIAPHRVYLRDLRSGETATVSPEVAIVRGEPGKVVEIGARARKKESPTVQVVNPFSHPRSLLSDYLIGEQLLKRLLAKVAPASLLRPAPRVVLHLQDDPQGGFTQVEIRAFHEMAIGAGASEAVLWHGPNLTDQQLEADTFPKEGQVLVPR